MPISFTSLSVSSVTAVPDAPWGATIIDNFIHLQNAIGTERELDPGDFATVTFTATAPVSPGNTIWNTAAWHKPSRTENLTETFAISGTHPTACQSLTISCPANTTVQCFSSVPVADPLHGYHFWWLRHRQRGFYKR